jgi:hypothetical protein
MDDRWRVRRVSPATLLLVAVGVVLVGSLVPAPSTGDASLAGPFGVGADKWVHAAGYAVVAGLAAATRDRHGVTASPRPVLRFAAVIAVVAAVAAFGAGVEVAQSFVPGRTTSGADAVANTVGAAVGVASWWLLVSIQRRPGTPSESP